MIRVCRCGMPSLGRTDSCQRCRRKVSNIVYHYKIDREQAHELVLQRHCDACGHQGEYCQGNLCVDHDHDTGEVRGVIHHNCNAGIGHAGENQEQLFAWSVYLARHQLDLRDLCTTTR